MTELPTITTTQACLFVKGIPPMKEMELLVRRFVTFMEWTDFSWSARKNVDGLCIFIWPMTTEKGGAP